MRRPSLMTRPSPLTRRLASPALAVAALLALAGCPAIDVATTVAEDRTAADISTDSGIKLAINGRLLGAEHRDLFTQITSDVYQGRVMLTGAVKTARDRDRAVEFVRVIANVREVINEIQVTDQGGFTNTTHDILIEQKLRAKLLNNEGFRSGNYRWRAVNGVVYLFGLAQSTAELERVIAAVKDTERVTRIVNHVRLKQQST